MHVMGEGGAARRLVAALGESLELAMRSRSAGMRNRSDGVRLFGQARPHANEPVAELAVPELAAAFTLVPDQGGRVRLKLTGEEPELRAVLTALRPLLSLLVYPAEAYRADGILGWAVYLHVETTTLPEPTGPVADTVPEQPRGSRWAPSERADRRPVTGRRALPRGRR
ncbi:hypothetical protein GCM10010428_49570 [Actinosynnema pretiosum subsp. pretiosum]